RMIGDPQPGPSVLERLDLAIASRLATGIGQAEPLAEAQRVLDQVRRPGPGDALFVASVLRLRGFVVTDDDAEAALGGLGGRLSPVSQEHRMLRGLRECLHRVRQRAVEGRAPDGWFLVDLFRTMTAELPRFRNNEVRRGPPWDAVLYVDHPPPEELHFLLDTFDAAHHFRDHPAALAPLHPVRQGFRLLWRFARIAPFPDFNLVMAWLLLNAWLQWRGYPLLPAEPGDQAMLARLIGGPPPHRIVQFEARLLSSVEQRRPVG
ncbi:MAG: hypothetical protein FJ265_05740, partial [Planctomycetes bacterium]|nr:hypothetical protein [Planctomycetota bacterium]